MIPCQKDQFSLDKEVHYLNCAYMSPLLKTVEEAGMQGMIKKRNPFQISPADFFSKAAEVRQLFGQLVNADAERIALIPSVSYGMGIIIQNIKSVSAKKIITVHEEFPSNVYSLQRICAQNNMELVTIAPPADSNNRGQIWNEKILEAINTNTALINLSSVHWADGTIFNLQAIGKRAKDVGALFVVDGTQSVGAMPFNVKEYNIDALFCAGYKWLLGPYTSGFAYFAEYFDNGIPIEESWLNRNGSDNFRALVDYEKNYRPLAARYNMGEYSNFINLPMLKTSLAQIAAWTPTAIQQYCDSLTQPLIQALTQNGFWIEEDTYRAKHLFGIRPPIYMQLEKLQQKLTDKKIFISLRGNMIRVSPHLYNNDKDVEQLLQCLLS